MNLEPDHFRGQHTMFVRFIVAAGLLLTAGSRPHAAESEGLARSRSAALRVATFDLDATPPIGSMMAYDPVTNRWDLGLRARGIVVLGAGEPMVLCAVDWIGLPTRDTMRFAKRSRGRRERRRNVWPFTACTNTTRRIVIFPPSE